MTTSAEPPPPRPSKASTQISSSRDAYTAGGDLYLSTHYSEQLHSAGRVSIMPEELVYPVRGRDRLVASILAAPPGSVHVLCGAGGSGKTTVALAVAEQSREQGAEVWQVSAADANTLDDGMRALALQLGVRLERLRLAWSPRGDAPDLVWELLASRERPWLLVVDNADDVRLLATDRGRGWIRRPPKQGRLLITSRNHNRDAWGRWAALYPLDELTDQAARQMLLDRAPTGGTDQQAVALAARLGHLPLLLHQAGLYLANVGRIPSWPGQRRKPRNFQEFRSVLDDRFGELLDSRLPYLPRQQVTATWELTLDLLADQGLPHARSLLRLLAHFADAPIPYAEVLSPTALCSSELFELPPDRDLQQAINSLADFGLLTTHARDPESDDPSNYTASMHPLVGEVTRSLDEVRPHRGVYLALAAQGLHDAARRRDPRVPSNWPFWQLAIPHLHRISELATGCHSHITAEHLTRTAVAGIQYATEVGLYALAETTAQHSASLATTLSSAHPAVLRLRHHRARLAYHRGDAAAAQTALAALLDVQQQTLGADHSDTLTTRNNLAESLWYQGHLDSAGTHWRAVLADRTRILGADHPDTLDTRHNLACLLAASGDLESAEAEARAVIADCTRVLGADHPDTFTTRHNLAGVLEDRGDLEAAEAEYRAVLADRTRVLGADHPDTLTTRNNLAVVRDRRGDLEAAEAEYRAVLADRTRVQGADHPDTLTTRNNLAGVLEDRGDLEAAEAEYRAVLADRTRVLGADHPDTLTTRNNLAVVRDRRGDLEAAEAEYRAVLADRTRVQGADHPDTLTTRNNLAGVLEDRGDLEAAEAEYRAVLADRTRVLGA
ncbi:FxSxx-COOH system tetratricopeptide repeat protein, partial [Streptomyces sp. NPDC057445]|uniref:FxSxx-COOH system tetratricopeptide repeat protein n=1 Tax=Streptomyces sp. NPDC057445 TaxID=3346136 RepID=UPI0036ADC6E3